MKTETFGILLALVGLYLASKSKPVASPLPGQPGFVGPVQGSSAATPPAINTPMQWVDCSQPNADPVICGLLANTPQWFSY